VKPPRRLFRRHPDPKRLSEVLPKVVARIDDRRKGYLEQLAEHGLKQTPGTIVVAQVEHDPSCRRPQGQECTCTPEITYRPLDDPSRN
jgi:hypothetical protein